MIWNLSAKIYPILLIFWCLLSWKSLTTHPLKKNGYDTFTYNWSRIYRYNVHLIQQTLLGAYTLQATSANNTHQTPSASTITKHTTSTRTPHSTSTLDGNQINTLWTLNQGTHWSVTAPIKLQCCKNTLSLSSGKRF